LRRVALFAVLAVVAAGCGGDERLSKSEYEQRMQEIGSELETASSSLGDLSQTGNLERLADRIAEFRDRLEDGASDIDDLNPPEDAETETQEIADSLQAFADAFGEMEQAARDGAVQELQQAQQEIAREGAEAQRAADALEAKGYDIGFDD
jgi:chromosome segregation ATPase